MSQNCISWRVSGICYWLFCTPFGCKVRTSVKVTHFIPKTVVSTYVAPGGNPWQEMSFVSQTNDDKASAVVAQRVADIITRVGQPHVYQVLQGNRHDGYWPPGEVTENIGTRNLKWQRLPPHMTQSCAVFPDGSYTVTFSRISVPLELPR